MRMTCGTTLPAPMKLTANKSAPASGAATTWWQATPIAWPVAAAAARALNASGTEINDGAEPAPRDRFMANPPTRPSRWTALKSTHPDHAGQVNPSKPRGAETTRARVSGPDIADAS